MHASMEKKKEIVPEEIILIANIKIHLMSNKIMK
jgi:hypothetical protein